MGFRDPIVMMKNNGSAVRDRWRSATLTGMGGMTLFPTAQGTGDGTVLYDFGPFINGYTGFIDAIDLPNGCFPGWLNNSLDGCTKFSPGNQYLFGSATLIDNQVVTFPTIYGLAQTPDGWNRGGWYFQMMMLHEGFATNLCGGGAGRAYNGGSGLQPNEWANNGGYSPTDVNGGGLVLGGILANNFAPSLCAQRNVVSTSPDGWGTALGAFVEFAVIMEPFIDPISFDPTKLIGINLPCVPCCPLEPCMRHY